MKRNYNIKRHVQSNICARITYRLICMMLVVAGVVGAYCAFGALEHFQNYSTRKSETTAYITKLEVKDDPSYRSMHSCRAYYKFEAANRRNYEGVSMWLLPPDKADCGLKVNESVPVRYNAKHPDNNNVGDNTHDRNVLAYISLSLMLLSAISFGVGAIGLIAIHRAVKQFDAEETELPTDKSKKRTTKRKSDK